MGLMPALPGEISQFTNFGLGNFTSIFQWLLVGLIVICILAVGYFIFHFSQFNYTLTTFPLFGSGNQNELAVGKKKWNKIKWNKSKTAWKLFWPIGTKKEIEPFDPKYIYPGNHIIAFKFGEVYMPAKLNIDNSEKTAIFGEINPVPAVVRNWQSLEHKKNADEFAEQSFWAENKALILMMITVIGCLVCAGVVIYLSYKFAGAGRIDAAAISDLTATLKGFVSAQAP